MAFHNTSCINCVGHLDGYKDMPYTMEWTYMATFRAGHAMPAIIADTLIIENMLPTYIAGNTLVHLDLFSLIPMKIVDDRSQKPQLSS